ncbi:MAG: hypothetical protein ACRBN8_46025 [Nannocystales bacterium]
MLVISDQQMDALSVSRLRQGLPSLLEQCFPDECATLGRALVTARVRAAVTRATLHGFTAPEHVTKFVCMTFLAGARFDEDRALVWAVRAVAAGRHRTADARMQALEDGLNEHLATRSGGGRRAAV